MLNVRYNSCILCYDVDLFSKIEHSRRINNLSNFLMDIKCNIILTYQIRVKKTINKN